MLTPRGATLSAQSHSCKALLSKHCETSSALQLFQGVPDLGANLPHTLQTSLQKQVSCKILKCKEMCTHLPQFIKEMWNLSIRDTISNKG